MSLYSEVCPILRQQKVGTAETGIHWTANGDIEVDNQEIIEPCLNCPIDPCWHDCKPKEREEKFNHECR